MFSATETALEYHTTIVAVEVWQTYVWYTVVRGEAGALEVHGVKGDTVFFAPHSQFSDAVRPGSVAQRAGRRLSVRRRHRDSCGCKAECGVNASEQEAEFG